MRSFRGEARVDLFTIEQKGACCEGCWNTIDPCCSSRRKANKKCEKPWESHWSSHRETRFFKHQIEARNILNASSDEIIEEEAVHAMSNE